LCSFLCASFSLAILCSFSMAFMLLWTLEFQYSNNKQKLLLIITFFFGP
jgi:hypothetical protein